MAQKPTRKSSVKILAMLGLLALSACSSPQQEAANYALRAQALYDAGKFQEANQEILKANAKRDDVAQQYLLQGRIALALQDGGEAFRAYSNALDLDAANQEALLAVAEVGLEIGSLQEAEKSADNLLLLSPGNTRALLVKGLIALDQRHLPQAQAIADQILKIRVTDEGGNILKARTLAVEGEIKPAIKIMEDLISTSGPSDAKLATMLELYRADGDVEKLLSTFEALLARMPDNTEKQIDFANALYKSGNVVRARKQLISLINTHGSDRDVLNNVISLWREYDPTPLKASDLAGMKSKGTNDVRLTVARYLLSTGDTSNAQALLRPLLDAGSIEARALYARILAAEGQTQKANTIADAILKEDETNTDALLLDSSSSVRSGDYAQAINDAQIVVREEPDNEEGYIALANVYAKSGEDWRVRQIFEKAISNLPQNISIFSRYVQFLYSAGDKERAMTVARDYTQNNPASLRGWDLLISACSRLEEKECEDEAHAGLKKAQSIFRIDLRPGAPRRRGLFGPL